MPRLSLALLLATLLAACGGGGGGGSGSATPASPREQTLRAILSDCGSATVGPFLEVVRALVEVLDPAAANPPLLVFGAPAGGAVPWTLDLDGDGTDDLAGSVRFLDASGATIEPFDLSQLASGGQRLASFFGGLPANTSVVVSYASAGAGNRTGTFTAAIESGFPDTLEGSGTTVTPDCSGTFSLEPTPPAALAGAFPVADLLASIQSDEGIALGVLAFDGTATATATVRLNGVGDAFELTVTVAG